MSSARVGCAVLSAGMSTRLGRPKPLLAWRGTTLVRHLASEALASRSNAVALVLGAHRADVASAVEELPIALLDNPDFASGLASSVRRAARWAIHASFDGLLVMTVDQPFVTARHLDALIDAHRDWRGPVCSAYQGVRGVPALFPKSVLDALVRLDGDTGARALLRAHPDAAVIDFPEGAFDIDHPSDVERAATLAR
jgi:molybdenum cofactor cytidylyltransferase